MTQESLCEAIEQQPIADQRESVLGEDSDGNLYIHFPVFCGDDLRIYRQAPFTKQPPDATATSCNVRTLKSFLLVC